MKSERSELTTPVDRPPYYVSCYQHNTPKTLTELLAAELHCGSCRRQVLTGKQNVWNKKGDILGSIVFLNCPSWVRQCYRSPELNQQSADLKQIDYFWSLEPCSEFEKGFRGFLMLLSCLGQPWNAPSCVGDWPLWHVFAHLSSVHFKKSSDVSKLNPWLEHVL